MGLTVILSILSVLSMATYLAIFEKDRQAVFFCTAWYLFIASCVVYLMKQFGVLPVNSFTNNAFKIGSIIEVSLLSLALADRLNVLSKELKGLNANLENQVAEKTQDIRSMLTHLPVGVFQVQMQSELKMSSEYSASLREMFGEQSYGDTNPIESIFRDSSLTEDQLKVLDTVLLVSLEEDVLQWEANSNQLPTHMTKQGKFIEISWACIADDDDKVAKVLCVLKDATLIRELEKQNRKNSQIAAKIEAIIASPHKNVGELFQTAAKIMAKCPDKTDHKADFRRLHTVKGLLRGTGFDDIVALVHSAESSISENRIQDLILHIEEIKTLIGFYRDINGRLFDRQKQTHQKPLENMVRLVMGSLEESPETARKDLLTMARMNLEGVLENEIQSLGAIATSLGKIPPRLEIAQGIGISLKISIAMSCDRCLLICLAIHWPMASSTRPKIPGGQGRIRFNFHQCGADLPSNSDQSY